MAWPIVASTQYGDFKGTVSIDEVDGVELLQLLRKRAKVARDYWPVGFSVAAVGTGRHPEHSWHLTVYAVDAQIAAGGQGIADYAQQNDRVPVFEFSEMIAPSELAELLMKSIKRFEMVAATRLLEGKPMVRLDDT